MSEQRYEHRIVATGEVRDADGNLLNTVTAESSEELTEDEAAELAKKLKQDEESSG
jgi:hypothetical protein